MTQQPQPPDLEKVKQRSAKMQEIGKRSDANILILDYIIGQLEEQNRQQPMYQYRLKKAMRLLDIDPDKFIKTETKQELPMTTPNS